MSDDYQRIELITGTARRRRWTTEQKLRIIEASCEPGESVSSVARRHAVAPNLLYRWRRLMAQGGAAAPQGAGKKTELAARVAAEGRFPMKTVADVLGVARSHLHERVHRPAPPRGHFCKADEELLPLIRRVVDQRPTYGYRRVTALVNRVLTAEGKPAANHKRIFRIMKRQGLLLQRYTGRRKGRLHDGKVVVMRSNLRWCSDVFEITCWNGEIVRIVFVIDAHDREVLAWHAVAGAGISGSTVRDLMLEAVELRFVTIQAPHAVEWLSDNGSPFTARETLDFAAALGLVPCFTPVHSPESNGIAEAFVKTFKRDYARVQPLPDAATVLRQIAGWFDDYNENHPHSGLGMISPREFIRAQTT